MSGGDALSLLPRVPFKSGNKGPILKANQSTITFKGKGREGSQVGGSPQTVLSLSVCHCFQSSQRLFEVSNTPILEEALKDQWSDPNSHSQQVAKKRFLLMSPAPNPARFPWHLVETFGESRSWFNLGR